MYSLFKQITSTNSKKKQVSGSVLKSYQVSPLVHIKAMSINLLTKKRFLQQNLLIHNSVHWNGNVIRMTAMLITGEVEDKFQHPRWRPGQSLWWPFCFCLLLSYIPAKWGHPGRMGWSDNSISPNQKTNVCCLHIWWQSWPDHCGWQMVCHVCQIYIWKYDMKWRSRLLHISFLNGWRVWFFP